MIKTIITVNVDNPIFSNIIFILRKNLNILTHFQKYKHKM